MAGPSFSQASDISSRVELSISCTNLKDLDYFSKSDPVVFIYEQRTSQRWDKIGRTEVIDNNLNPRFAKTFLVDYLFEDVQKLKFVVYDVDDRKRVEETQRHDLIGDMECTLAEIVTAGQQYKRTLRERGSGPSRGQIIIVAEEVQDSKFTIYMQLSASKLDKKDWFGKSDPLFEISKAQEGGSFTTVYRSQPIMKTLDPKWPQFSIPIRQLCSGDWDRSLKFSVWDWNRSGDHDYIGSCNTSLREICPERGGQIFHLELINQDMKGKKKKYKNSGTLNFVSVKATPLHTFVDYIRGGCEISLMVAIDFTASNGNPQDSKSLHYKDQYKDNSYVTAIKSVGSVLAPYDSDQLIPVYGFGARIPPAGEVSHCFPITMNPQRPEVTGVQGILDAYHRVINQIQFYGPTNFSSFLDEAIRVSRSSVTQQSQSYNILLVITDGVISDMARTVDKIVEASKLPLSIVIVGVGGADFKNMEILDADDEPLKSRSGELMCRDIVQFVPLRQFQGGANSRLAKETLAEIPDQLLSFMKRSGINPNPPALRREQNSVIQHAPPNQAPANSSQPSQPTYPGSNPASQAPYPSSNPANQAPYPSSNPASQAPYPSSNPTSQAPYPPPSYPSPTSPYAGTAPPYPI